VLESSRDVPRGSPGRIWGEEPSGHATQGEEPSGHATQEPREQLLQSEAVLHPRECDLDETGRLAAGGFDELQLVVTLFNASHSQRRKRGRGARKSVRDSTTLAKTRAGLVRGAHLKRPLATPRPEVWVSAAGPEIAGLGL